MNLAVNPGGRPGLPAADLSGLAGELSDHGGEACAELDRLDAVLADAIVKLLDSFGTVQVLSTRQQAIALEMATAAADAGRADVDGQVAELRSLERQMQASMGRAVTALQFQDMATQILAHAKQRWIEACEVALRVESKRGANGESAQPRAAAGNDQDAAVPGGRSRTRPPVPQGSVDAGSVDLF